MRSLYFWRRKDTGQYRASHPFAGTIWLERPCIDQAAMSEDEARKGLKQLQKNIPDCPPLEIVEFHVVFYNVID